MSEAGWESADGPAGEAVPPRGETRRRLLHAGTLAAAVVGLGCLLYTRHTL